MGHSIWSDDGSTRHITVEGGIDSRFNPVQLSPGPGDITTRPRSAIPSAIPIPYFAAAPDSPLNAPWTPNRRRESDEESQASTLTEDRDRQVGRITRFSQLFKRLKRQHTLWEKVQGQGRARVGWKASLKKLATFTYLNILLIFIPIAWGVHFSKVSHIAKFMLNFIAIIPLSKLLDFGGEQLALYCGRAIGDLITISLNNAVEASLAMVLLTKCELRLLQSTVVGVVLLRLLLVPGTAFITGGARVLSQELHPHFVHLNHSLLTMGALTLLLPLGYFLSLDRLVSSTTQRAEADLTDAVRGDLLKLSRALAIFLLVVYICSRFYLHNPPGESDTVDEEAPDAFKADLASLEEEQPEIDSWVCIVMLVLVVAMTAVTAEFLVTDIHPVEQRLGLKPEYFGLIVLPFVSYAADGILSTAYFIRSNFTHYIGAPPPISTLAKGRSIDLAIQFFIFWMPFTIIVAWCAQKPLSLLFNIFEVGVLLGACFLVNYVTADAKTNWAEGMMMVVFYVMIAVVAFFYPGQTDIRHLGTCSTVASAVHREHQLYALHKAQAANVTGTHVNTVHGEAEGHAAGTTGTTVGQASTPDQMSERLQKILQRYNVLAELEEDDIL